LLQILTSNPWITNWIRRVWNRGAAKFWDTYVYVYIIDVCTYEDFERVVPDEWFGDLESHSSANALIWTTISTRSGAQTPWPSTFCAYHSVSSLFYTTLIDSKDRFPSVRLAQDSSSNNI